MKQLAFLFACIVVFPMQAADSDTVLQQHVRTLITSLSDESAQRRMWAAGQLMTVGEPALSLIIENYPKQNFLARREIAGILGKIATPKAVMHLINCMYDQDRGVRSRASMELVALTDHVPGILEKIAQLKPKTLEIAEDIKTLRRTILRKTVEQKLGDLISPQGGWGFYEGQFEDLLPLKADAVPILLDIFIDQNYEFTVVKYDSNSYIADNMRSLAGDAIGDFSPFIAGKLKTQVINGLRTMRIHKGKVTKQLWEIATYSLYRLGEKNELNAIVRNYLSKATMQKRSIAIYRNGGNKSVLNDSMRELGGIYSELSIIYLRIHEDSMALEYLNGAISNDPGNSLNYYNLACAYACMGKIDKGLDALEKSVQIGYNDLGWMRKDGDLRHLRESPRYKKIIAGLEGKFNK